MVARGKPLAAWVRIGADDNPRWPEWRRRWFVLEDGRVFVPVPHTPATTEGAAAIRERGPFIRHAGHVLVEAAWLIERRTGEGRAMLRAMVDRVANLAG